MDSERGNRLREVRELLRVSQQYLADLQEIKRAIEELKRAKAVDNGSSIIDFSDKDYDA